MPERSQVCNHLCRFHWQLTFLPVRRVTQIMSIIRHDYNGFEISQEPDGYVCLTDMAKASGKRVNDYLTNSTAKDYLAGLATDTGIPASALVKVFKGGAGKQGTWAHPEIAIDFAQWCSVLFKIWANRHLRKAIESGATVVDTPKPLAAYTERVRSMHEDFKNIPKDHWCILHESANLLIWIECVMKYPVDRGDIVDASIGIQWANYRKGKAWAKDRTRADYKFPKGLEVFPWTYHYDELSHFKKFMEDLYKPKFLPQYLERKYGKLVKSQQSLLDLL